MALELYGAILIAALPDVLVLNLVAVLGRHLHATVTECLRTFAAPFLELPPVRLVLDSGDHEVR